MDSAEFSGAQGSSRRDALKWLGVAGGAVGASSLLAACAGATGGRSSSSSGGGVGSFPSTPKWNFVFINHVTTNSFFTPTRYGLSDAASMLNLPTPQWTGAEDGSISTMVNAFETAITSGAHGIAIALTDASAFIEPTKAALAKGIPVVAYNAAAAGNTPLAYVGQDLYLSGYQMGQRIAKDVGSGEIIVGISQPGGSNVQPRLDGISAALKDAGGQITVTSINTGAAQAGELNAMNAAYSGHPNVKGIYAVDAGSTAAVANVVKTRGLTGKIKAGGYDLLADTLTGIKAGNLDFTIDQSAYLQGFLPVLYLYMYRLSGTLVFPPNSNTGMTFVTKDNVDPYITANSRFEGGSQNKVLDVTGAIAVPAAITATH